MAIILGIDPGSRVTGYGIVEVVGQRLAYVGGGSIHCLRANHLDRLRIIFDELTKLIEHYQPEIAVVEQVFMHKNPSSALKLGQARGAVMVALATQNVSLAEYSPATIKQAVVGNGNASKGQVQHMIKILLKLSTTLRADEADALAMAICHAHQSKFRQMTQLGV